MKNFAFYTCHLTLLRQQNLRCYARLTCRYDNNRHADPTEFPLGNLLVMGCLEAEKGDVIITLTSIIRK
jgi:hypothetical protein